MPPPVFEFYFMNRTVNPASLHPRTITVTAWLLALALMCATMPEPARAGELEYQNCLRQLCTSYGKDENECVQSCLRDLNGPDQTMPLPPVPRLFGAIALDGNTFGAGFGKGFTTLAAAEKRALAICRRDGGSAKGCRIVESGHNVCLALVTSKTPAGKGISWGSAHSDDGWVSRRDATNRCRQYGGTTCKVTVTFCTG
jgi:hypothetical protein